MFNSSIFILSSLFILSVTSHPLAPARYSDDYSYEVPSSFWYPRSPMFPGYAQPIPSGGADIFTQLINDLQRRLIEKADSVPTISVSSSASDEVGGSSVSFGGFGSLLPKFGFGDSGSETEIKNKTTTKTEIIDGHKVITKDTVYVSGEGDFKSVVHITEVDVIDDEDQPSNEDKPNKSKPSTPEPETEEETTPKESSEETPEDDKTSTTTTTAKPTTERDNKVPEIEETDEDVEKVEDEKTVNPDDEIINASTENEIDSSFQPLRSGRVARSTGSRGDISLHADTRVNQLISEKQKNSGLYSIDPDAELLDENTFYEADGQQRPMNNQEVYYVNQQVDPAINQIHYTQSRTPTQSQNRFVINRNQHQEQYIPQQNVRQYTQKPQQQYQPHPYQYAQSQNVQQFVSSQNAQRQFDQSGQYTQNTPQGMAPSTQYSGQYRQMNQNEVDENDYQRTLSPRELPSQDTVNAYSTDTQQHMPITL